MAVSMFRDEDEDEAEVEAPEAAGCRYDSAAVMKQHSCHGSIYYHKEGTGLQLVGGAGRSGGGVHWSTVCACCHSTIDVYANCLVAHR